MVRELAALYERLAIGALRDDDVVPLDVTRNEGNPQFLRYGINTGVIDQPEALVFKHLTAEDGVILDVGAHWGYMAMSILNSGTTCPVLSFEAIPYTAHCLDVLRSISANFDFIISAASDAAREVVFYNPVVNGIPLSGLNSINGGTLDPWHVPFTVESIEKYMGASLRSGAQKLQLGVFKIEARTLDDLIANRTFRFPVDHVAAIKIDVEGHDAAVLSGARQTIRRNRPLLLVEGGSAPAIMSFMAAEGYRMVQKNDDHLVPLDGHQPAVNEFFVHSSKANRFEKIGLLRGSGRSID